MEANQLFVSIGTTKVFRWMLTDDNFRNRAANDVRAGYIYPLYTPGGLDVADDYASDHPHMHGIWSAWTITTFRDHAVDFWNGYANQGHVDLESMDGAWSGPVHAGLVANIIHDDITTTPDVTVLNEKWVVTVYKTHDGAPPYFIFDIDSMQTTATPDPLILDQYHYGGFGFRGAEEWATAATFLTSEGHSRTSGDGQNARWVQCTAPSAAGSAAMPRSVIRATCALRRGCASIRAIRIGLSSPSRRSRAVATRSAIVPYRSRFRVVTFDGNADSVAQPALGRLRDTADGDGHPLSTLEENPTTALGSWAVSPRSLPVP